MHYHLLTGWFSLITDSNSYEQLHALLQGCWSMGAVNPWCGGHIISAPSSQLQLRVIMLSELHALSLTGAWGDIEKPRHNMAFLLIVPDKNVKGERVFGLVAVWAHLHQACHHSLGEAAHKLPLLIDISTNWAYGFTWLNEDALHTPLSSEGHMTAMIAGASSMSTCGCISQLEVCKLLQCGDQVVCLGALNGG